MMDPTYLFTDVGMFVDVGISTGPQDCIAKGHLMEVGSAGSHYNPVDGAVLQILNNQILPRVGAQKHIFPSNYHSRDLSCLIAYLRHIHVIGNVATTAANVNSYLPF